MNAHRVNPASPEIVAKDAFGGCSHRLERDGSYAGSWAPDAEAGRVKDSGCRWALRAETDSSGGWKEHLRNNARRCRSRAETRRVQSQSLTLSCHFVERRGLDGGNVPGLSCHDAAPSGDGAFRIA